MIKNANVSLSREQLKKIMGGGEDPKVDLKPCTHCWDPQTPPPMACEYTRCEDEPIVVVPNP